MKRPSSLERYLETSRARVRGLRALLSPAPKPKEQADALESVAAALRATQDEADDSPQGRAWGAFVVSIEALARLHRWDAAIRDGEKNAGRLRDACARRAEVALPGILEDDPLLLPLRRALEGLRSIKSPSEIDPLRKRIAAIPLPSQFLERDRPRIYPRQEEPGEPPTPLAVCLVVIDGTPVTHAHIVHTQRVYDLDITVRLTDWPEWATHLEVEFLSELLQPTAISLPSFTAARPGRDSLGLFTVEGRGQLVLAANQRAGARPLSCALAVRLCSEDRQPEVVETAGYAELRIRAFDPSRDELSGHSQLDERLVGMLSALHDPAILDGDARAFCRFFTAITRAAVKMQADNLFRRGENIRESGFQEELFDRLLDDPSLGKRVRREEPRSGGFADLVHDGIVAELKIERKTPATVENAVRYLGQPVQYATSGGSQLSILCILDVCAKEAPAGVLENYVDWLKPAVHGLHDSKYPSLVGVIILNGNLPLPSGWAGRRIETTD